MNKKLLILLPALALLLGGCQKGNANSNNSSANSSQPTSSSSEEVAVEGVNISQTSATLDPGEKLQLSAVATPSTLSEKGVNWSTDAGGVATVSSGGLVTAVSEGTAHIKATAKADSTKSATCTVTVNKAQVLVFAESIDLEKTYKLGLYQTKLDKNLYFNGEVTDSNGLRFDSSDSWADAVDVKVEQKVAGVYHLAATVGGAKKYLCTVSSSDYHAALKDTADTDWEWDEKYYTFTTTVGTTKYFVGTNGTYETLSFSDYSKYVASNDVIRLMYKVDKVDPTSVSIVEDAANVYAGGSVQLHAKAAPEGASGATIEWSVTGNNKVTVSKTGLVEAAADAEVGSTATVKATWGSLEGDTCVVTVKEKLNYGTLDNPLTIAEAKALIDKGNPTAEPLFVKGVVTSSKPYDSGYKTWAYLWLSDGEVEQAFEGFRLRDGSSDGSFATTYKDENSLVGKTVTITGIGTIFGTTYETTNADTSKLMKVEDVAIDPKSVKLDCESTFELEQGASATVKATILPYGASGTIDWSLEKIDDSDLTLISVENGVVTAKAEAVAGAQYKLVAAVNGHSDIKASATITIKAAAAGTKVVFDVTSQIADPSAAYTGGSVQITNVDVDEHIKLAVSGGGNNGKIYKSNDYGFQTRLYVGGGITITAGTGYVITSVVGSGSINDSSWWGKPEDIAFTVAANGSSATYSAEHKTCLYTITVIYTAA